MTRVRRSPCEIAAEVAAALMKAPRSISQVAAIVYGDARVTEQARLWVDQFRASGLVRVSGHTAHGHPIYAWQTAPFAMPDVELERPDFVGPIRPASAGRLPQHFVRVDGERMPVTAAAKALGIKRRTLYGRVVRGQLDFRRPAPVQDART